MSDTLSNGGRFRFLWFVDNFSREGLGTMVNTQLSGVREERELEHLSWSAHSLGDRRRQGAELTSYDTRKKAPNACSSFPCSQTRFFL